jgi:hypothetical protein
MKLADFRYCRKAEFPLLGKADITQTSSDVCF